MFIHLNIFKRKEERYEAGYPELTRKNRVEKTARKPGARPSTAPGVLELPTQGPVSRSFQYDTQSAADEPLRAPVPLYAAARLPTPRDEFSRPPLAMRRSLSSASCVIRNPFRSDTSDSIATVAHLPEGSTESVDVIQRTVLSHTPTRRTTPPYITPQRAAIFTRQGPVLCSDETLSESDSPAMRAVLTRSKSLNHGKVSYASRSVRPPLLRLSHKDNLSSKPSSRRAH